MIAKANAIFHVGRSVLASIGIKPALYQFARPRVAHRTLTDTPSELEGAGGSPEFPKPILPSNQKPAAEEPAPSAACSTSLRCAPRAIRIPGSFSRLLIEYAAMPKIPVMDSTAIIAPSTPSDTVAMREGNRGSCSSLIPRFDIGKQPRIQVPQRTPHSCRQLLGIAVVAHRPVSWAGPLCAVQ